MSMYQKNKKDLQIKQALEEKGIKVQVKEVNFEPNDMLTALSNMKPLLSNDPFAREEKKAKPKKAKSSKKDKK